MTDDRKCDSTKRGVKGMRKLSQLMERCKEVSGGVGWCDSCQEV